MSLIISINTTSNCSQDLDHTILCSICPLQNDEATPSEKSPTSLMPSPPSLQYFDQIDDDFPYDHKTLEPNTRTYFRPGARTALQICSYFSIMHVYTAAQETYTNNIMNELDPDRTVFEKVLHRDEYPEIVKKGKDLSVATERLERAILFDDKISNFQPQEYQNGIAVVPFNAKRVEQCQCGCDNDRWNAYLTELKEMARLVGISFWSSIHFSGDVRKVVHWVRGWSDDN